RYHEYDLAVPTIQESLYRANLDYYDLYLIHWPNPIQDNYVEAWESLIQAQKWGLVRSIGVCNFLPEHIERLEKETGVKPSIKENGIQRTTSKPNLGVRLHVLIKSLIKKRFNKLLQLIRKLHHKSFYVGIINLGLFQFLNHHPKSDK